MAGIKLNHIYKVYPNGTKAVNDFNMSIEDKEFIVFVGPSGCGKSTTLRMIAGLEEITAGELLIDGELMNNVEPKDRDIAMVFQNYALYPHMTVYENMAFGLKLRKVPKQIIDQKVKEAAEILGITEYLKSKPKEMSGGQRQRVALGRAIVREPKVFLLDEPLSNLDAKLRTTMRSEISKLHHKLQTTFVYVTHDQVEAMTMGTRIVVMKLGFVQQIDTPRNLYNYPVNKFVAGFIGTPQMNFYNGTILLDGENVKVAFTDANLTIDAPNSIFNKADRKFLDGKYPLTLGIRSEFISVNPDAYPYKAKCRVSHVEELGTECLVYGDLDVNNQDVMESPTKIVIKALAGTEFELGQIIDISINLEKMQVFDNESEFTILPRIPQNVVVDASVKNGVLDILGSKLKLPSALEIPNGDYKVTIPTTAVSLGGKVKATVLTSETIGKQRMVHLTVGDRVLFALNDTANLETTEGITIDTKQLTFANDTTTILPIPEFNELSGKIVRFKMDRKLDKKAYKYYFKLDIGGVMFDYPLEKAALIVNGGGKKILDKELLFRFAPQEIVEKEGGIVAKVEKVLNYGEEFYAKCIVGDKTIFKKVDKDFDKSELTFAPDISSLVVIEKDRDIRLV